MNFFNSIIDETAGLLAPLEFRRCDYCESQCWRDSGRNQLVMLRDMAFELGGSGKPALGFNLVTSADIGKSEIVIAGSELSQLKGDCSFARISVIQINDIADEQEAYNTIRKIEYIKYHYFPEGYMMRTSSENFREQVRVSRNSLKDGISFEKLGNSLIKKYLEQPAVKAVKIIFLADSAVNYDELIKIAEKNNRVVKALNHALSNINFDCSVCSLKPVCDEVEGMRELHFKNKKMQ